MIAPISLLELDLSSFRSFKAAVRAFRDLETCLDILINNAGVMMTSEGLTEDGCEIQFGTNHMGHALLMQLLLPVLQKTAKAGEDVRVINVSSASEMILPSHIYKFNEFETAMTQRNTRARYCISEIASLYYTSAIAERYSDVKFIGVHAGMVATNLYHNASEFFLKTFLNVAINAFATPVGQGALNQIWASVSSEAKIGDFYAPVGLPCKSSKLSRDRALGEQLWNWTQQEILSHL